MMYFQRKESGNPPLILEAGICDNIFDFSFHTRSVLSNNARRPSFVLAGRLSTTHTWKEVRFG